MFDDTSLVRMVVEELVKKYQWTYEEAWDNFYRSETCKNLSNIKTGLFTFSPKEILEVFDEELKQADIE